MKWFRVVEVEPSGDYIRVRLMSGSPFSLLLQRIPPTDGRGTRWVVTIGMRPLRPEELASMLLFPTRWEALTHLRTLWLRWLADDARLRLAGPDSDNEPPF